MMKSFKSELIRKKIFSFKQTKTGKKFWLLKISLETFDKCIKSKWHYYKKAQIVMCKFKRKNIVKNVHLQMQGVHEIAEIDKNIT